MKRDDEESGRRERSGMLVEGFLGGDVAYSGHGRREIQHLRWLGGELLCRMQAESLSDLLILCAMIVSDRARWVVGLFIECA